MIKSHEPAWTASSFIGLPADTVSPIGHALLELAEALERRGEAFDPLYTNMVAAGEAGGILDIILKRLSAYIEKQVKLRAQVRSAMIYPSAVLSIAAIVVVVILWKVVPTFTLLFAGMGATLPLPTRVVIALSNGLIYALPFLAGGCVGAAYLMRRYYRTPVGRMRVDRTLLSMPMIGKDRKSTRLNSSHMSESRMPSSA